MFATIFVLQNATVVNIQMISHHFIEISFILFFHIYLNTFLTNKKNKNTFSQKKRTALSLSLSLSLSLYMLSIAIPLSLTI